MDVMRDEQRQAVRAHVAAVEADLNSTTPLKAFKTFSVAEQFVANFATKQRRQPMLVIIGGTNSGKSCLAGDILKKVGALLDKAEHLEVTVEGAETLDFGGFDVERHAGVLLDGVGDAQILKTNRETLQGKANICEGAKSATMMYANEFTLCRRAVIVTMDLGALNLHLFSVDHWLSDSKNCMVLRLEEPAWLEIGEDDGGNGAARQAAASPLERMLGWSVAELARFLESRDLRGPAEQLSRQGVRGEDFVTFVDHPGFHLAPFFRKRKLRKSLQKKEAPLLENG